MLTTRNRRPHDRAGAPDRARAVAELGRLVGRHNRPERREGERRGNERREGERHEGERSGGERSDDEHGRNERRGSERGDLGARLERLERHVEELTQVVRDLRNEMQKRRAAQRRAR